MPILTIRPKLVSVKGKVEMDDAICKFGIVKMGEWGVKAFPNGGITINMQGGTWKVHGKVWIGANSSLEIGKYGVLTMEDDFVASTGFRVFCYNNIIMCRGIHFGWNCTVLDTNFHPLTDITTGTLKRCNAPIIIEENNWFGSNCVVMPGAKTPKFATWGMGSYVVKRGNYEPYSVHAGNPLQVVSRGVYRDYNNDLDPLVYGETN